MLQAVDRSCIEVAKTVLNSSSFLGTLVPSLLQSPPPLSLRTSLFLSHTLSHHAIWNLLVSRQLMLPGMHAGRRRWGGRQT
jgi:hypothetical protein